ncbi:MAG: glycosyltransferase family 39 protein [Aquihabitans sp.]
MADRVDDGRRFAIGLGAISLVALVFRLTLLANIAKHNPTGGDPFYYHEQANMLVEGHGFSDPFGFRETGRYNPVAIHPPVFTLWLALASAVGLKGYLAHKVMSCLAGALAVAAIGIFGREVAGRRAGLLAAALAAVYPPLWSIDGQLWPEGLFTAVVALACWSALKAWRRPGWRWAALAGALVALAALTRGEAIALTALLIVPILLLRRERALRSNLFHLAAAAMACVAVLAPWTVRNAVTFNHVVALSTNSDEVVVYANNPYAYGTADGGRFLGFWFYPWQDELRRQNGEPPGDASDKALYWRQQGLAYARAHKDRLPVVVAARVGRAWNVYAPFQNASFDQIDGKSRAVSVAGVWAWWAVLAGSIPALIILRRRKVTIIPFLALAGTVTLSAIYAYGGNRFRTPLDLAALVLTAVTIDAALRQLDARSVQRRVEVTP